MTPTLNSDLRGQDGGWRGEIDGLTAPIDG
jgi:hypothetical protein